MRFIFLNRRRRRRYRTPERELAKKRRNRARRHSLGLRSDGRLLKDPHRQSVGCLMWHAPMCMCVPCKRGRRLGLWH